MNIELLDSLTSLSEQINAIAYSLPSLKDEHKEIFFGELMSKSDQLTSQLKAVVPAGYRNHLSPNYAALKSEATPLSSFPLRLKRAMKAAGLTQKELAERAGVSQSVISRLITGKDKTGTRSGVLSHALGVSFDWLHYGTGEMYPANFSADNREV